jgi:hypothetical protein
MWTLLAVVAGVARVAAAVAATVWLAAPLWRGDEGPRDRRRWLLRLEWLAWAVVLVALAASFEVAFALGGRPVFC